MPPHPPGLRAGGWGGAAGAAGDAGLRALDRRDPGGGGVSAGSGADAGGDVGGRADPQLFTVPPRSRQSRASLCAGVVAGGGTNASGVVVRSPCPFPSLAMPQPPTATDPPPRGSDPPPRPPDSFSAATLLARPGSPWPPPGPWWPDLWPDPLCSAPMTTSPSPAPPSHSPSNGASPASLPRWRRLLSDSCHPARHLGATLQWRRDSG